MKRWQTLTSLDITYPILDQLATSCAEFLIHAADVEGQCQGMDEKLIDYLGAWGGIPMTYAGGASALADLACVETLAADRLDLTIGSALDIFGGHGVRYADCVAWNNARRE
jgi:phosphoribosylformimino-5-aminoimidazole carboxamide ribotide isomerase